MKIIFILDDPAVAENVGAAARAMKTMGFSEMRIIKSEVHKEDKARWLAHGAVDVLEKASLFETLEDAVKDIDFLIGTTAKSRSIKHDYYTPHELVGILKSKKSIISKVGILFGKEESGLSNRDLAICHIATSIPLRTKFPSLNLGQCIMLYAYELSALNLKGRKTGRELENKLFGVVREKAEETLSGLGFELNSNIYNRLLERLAVLNEDDTRLVLSVIEKLNKKKRPS